MSLSFNVRLMLFLIMTSCDRKVQSTSALPISTTTAMQSLSRVRPHGRRILWNGPLFGRLSKAGREYLIQRGGWTWLEKEPGPEVVLNHPKSRLAFVWPNKSGPQFAMDDAAASHIRPYPKSATDLLDDKICLAELLQQSSQAHDIAPKVISSPKDAEEGILYFVKHRFGAQGKSVYVYNKTQLEAWWKKSQNSHDFVIQKEVIPALDEHGRKFVLRCHVLLVQPTHSPLKAYLHKDVICSPHASPYIGGSANVHSCPKSSHVSQAGKKHPPPVLWNDLSTTHPASGLWSDLLACATKLVAATTCGKTIFHPETRTISSNPFHAKMAEATTCFALLGADLLVSNTGKVVVCEVNSHPALGWGTMAQVPSAVFRELIQDTLSIVVFGDDEVKNTKFVPLHY